LDAKLHIAFEKAISKTLKNEMEGKTLNKCSVLYTAFSG
jgi:hypothetical protein